MVAFLGFGLFSLVTVWAADARTAAGPRLGSAPLQQKLELSPSRAAMPYGFFCTDSTDALCYAA